MKIVKASAAYFALVFGAGFIFGALRVSLLVPRLGVRTAELMEMPLMLVVIVMSARFVTRSFALSSRSIRLGVGLLALSWLITAELAFVVALQGLSISQYIASRDPVSGDAYLILLGLFALMPLILARVATSKRGNY